MARGRLITKDIALSKRLAKLKTDSARMLWCWIYPHLDVEGRIYADPIFIRAQIIPRLESWSLEKIEECLKDMADVKVITLYGGPDGDKYMSYYNFNAKQGHRKDREAPSKIPPPPSTPNKRRSLLLEVYNYVWDQWQKNGMICPVCNKKGEFVAGEGIVVDGYIPFEIDHIIPLSKGGSDEKENLRVICRTCNRTKGVNMEVKTGGDSGVTPTNSGVSLELLQPRVLKEDLEDEFGKPSTNHNSLKIPEQLRSNSGVSRSKIASSNAGETASNENLTDGSDQTIDFKKEIDSTLKLFQSNSGATPELVGVTPGLYLYLYIYYNKHIPHMKRKLVREKYGLDEDIFSLWKEFKKYLRRIKREITPKGEAILLGSLAELIEKKKGTAKLIIERTIASGKWPSFYPVPGYEPPTKPIQSSTPLPSPAERPSPEETKKYSREALDALNKGKKRKTKKPKGRNVLFERTNGKE